MERIPVAGPWITEKEEAYVLDAVRNGWYANANQFQRRFESAFANYTGRRYAVALPSATSGLHLALVGLDLQPGDEVIVPEITWIATSAPVSYVGATPVFCDIEERSWCLSVDSLREWITPRTRALILVNLYGNMPDMGPILELADSQGITVIEDAAESVGAEYHGKRAGSFGLASVFSFHGSKTLTTGEGGILLTDDQALYTRVLTLRDHGRIDGPRMFWNGEVAYKYKMSALQAALGLAQLERVAELDARKREIFSWYAEDLQAEPGITLNQTEPGVKNAYWMVTAIFDPGLGLLKEEVISRLGADGIDTRPFFYPLSSQPAYASQPSAAEARRRNRVAYRVSPYGVNLPSALSLTRDQVRFVCTKLHNLLERRAAA